MKSVPDIFHTSWAELSHRQAIQIMLIKSKIEWLAKAEYYEAMGEMEHAQLVILCKDQAFLKKLSQDQEFDVWKDLAFINEPWYFFHIAAIRGKEHVYFSPMEKIHDLTFQHLVYADANFSKYLITEETVYLEKLISILYHPSDGDDRWPLITENIEPMAIDIGKRIHPHEKQLIMVTYSHIRSSILQRCPTLFNVDGSEDDDEGKIEYTGEMWRNLLFDLSETPAFQGMQIAKDTPIYEALDYLEKKAIEVKQYKPV